VIVFLFDASAMARHYFADIGTSNIDQIMAYPESIVAFPSIIRVEVVGELHPNPDRQRGSRRRAGEGPGSHRPG
jgi:hypothetical protein